GATANLPLDRSRAGGRGPQRQSTPSATSPAGGRSRRSVPTAPLVPHQSGTADQCEPGESRGHRDVRSRVSELLAAVLGRPVLVGRAGAAGGAVLTGGTAVGELRLHRGEGQTRLAVGDPVREQRGHQHRERGGLLLLTGVLGRRGRGVVARRILVLRGGGIGLVRVLVRVLTGRR